MAKEEHDNGPCQKAACEIQTCLQKNNYDQKRCEETIQKYNNCIKKYKESKNTSE